MSGHLLPIVKEDNRYTVKGKITSPAWGTTLLGLYCVAINKPTKSYSVSNVGLITEGQKLTLSSKNRLSISFEGLKFKTKPGAKMPIKIHLQGTNEACLGISLTDKAVLSLLDPLEKKPQDHFYNPSLRNIAAGSTETWIWPVLNRNWGYPSSYIETSGWGWKAPGTLLEDIDKYNSIKIDKSNGEFDAEENGNVYVMKGKSSSKQGAVVDAYKKSMIRHLKRNMDEDSYDENKRKIKDFLKRKWSEYVVGDWENPQVVRRYRRRRIKIKCVIDGKKLLKDIKRRTERGRAKIEGFGAGIIPATKWSDLKENEKLDWNIAFNLLNEKLSRHMLIRNLKNTPPTGASRFNDLQILIKLTISTRKQTDSSGTVRWYATMNLVVEHMQTSRELARLQGTTGIAHKAREEAIKNVAHIMVQKLIRKIRTRRTTVRRGFYDIKFVGFSREQHQSIDDAFADLAEARRPYCKVLSDDFVKNNEKHMKIKWLRTRDSQHRIIGIIKEVCAENEVIIEAKLATQSHITFEQGEEEDGDDNGDYEAPAASRQEDVPKTSATVKPKKQKVKKKKKPKVITIRKNFAKTSLWQPMLVTKDGFYAIDLPIPDAITEQNLTVMASDHKGAIALEQKTIKVRQDLFVRSSVPAKVTHGDILQVYAQVHNFTGKTQKLKATFSSKKISLHSPAIVEIEIPNRHIAPVAWKIEAKECGNHSFTIGVQNQDFLDSETHKVFVAPAGEPYVRSYRGNAASNKPWQAQIAINKEATYNTAFLNISFPGVAPALQGLESLIRFPHGCAEQTSSKILINAQVLKWAIRRNLRNSDVKKLPENLRYGVARLAAMQNQDGGWSWFGERASNHYLTNYCLYTLNKTRQADIVVDQKIIEKAIEYLLRHNENGLWQPRRSFVWINTGHKTSMGISAEFFATLIEAISFLPQRNTYLKRLAPIAQKIEGYLKKNPKESLTITSAISGLLQWHKWIKQPGLKKLLDTSLQHLIALNKTDHWSAHGYKGYGGEVEVNAKVLELLNKQKKSHMEVVQKSTAWLLAQRVSNGGWYNTKATAAAIEALLALESETESAKVQVYLNDKEVKTVNIDPKDPFLSALTLRNLEISSYLKAEENHIKVLYSGKLKASIILESREWGLKRTVDKDFTLTRHSPKSLNWGEPAMISLKISSPKIMPFVVIEDKIPATMIVEQRSLVKLKQLKIISDYKIMPGVIYFYLDRLDKKLNFNYALYAVGYGKAKHPGVSISSMYNPLQKAVFIGKEIEVKN